MRHGSSSIDNLQDSFNHTGMGAMPPRPDYLGTNALLVTMYYY
jgi:hypothetical protein